MGKCLVLLQLGSPCFVRIVGRSAFSYTKQSRFADLREGREQRGVMRALGGHEGGETIDWM